MTFQLGGSRWWVATVLVIGACGRDGGGASDDGTGESSADASGEDTVDPTAQSSDEASSDGSGDTTTADPCSVPDADGDGHDAAACGGDDCDDLDALAHPGVEHDGWEQLLLYPVAGGGLQYPTWITGADGLVDFLWAYNNNLWHVAQESEALWGGPVQVGVGTEPRVAPGVDGSLRMVYTGATADLQSRGVFYTQIGATEVVTLETLPVESPNAFGLDLEVDPATGAMHVVYGVLYEFPPTLRYATSANGQDWTVETIAEEAAGFGGTLALDEDGTPHVSFASNANEVMHGVRTDGAWTVEVAASGYEVAATSMARDPAGELHIAFSVTGLEDAEDGLHYVRTAGGEWAAAVEVDTNVVWYDQIGLWDYRPSIGLGADGQPHLAYHDYGAGVLRYATLIGGAWQRKVIDDGQGAFTPQAGWYAELDLEDGVLNIGGSSDATNEYRHLSFVPDDGHDNDCDGAIDEGP